MNSFTPGVNKAQLFSPAAALAAAVPEIKQPSLPASRGGGGWWWWAVAVVPSSLSVRVTTGNIFWFELFFKVKMIAAVPHLPLLPLTDHE